MEAQAENGKSRVMENTVKPMDYPRRAPRDINAIIGANIRIARTARGISQERLAHKLGMSYQALQKWEAGHVSIAAAHLVAISSILTCNLMEFYVGVDYADDRAPLARVETIKDANALDSFKAIRSYRVKTAVQKLMEALK